MEHEHGYYWLVLEDAPAEVVEIDGASMYRCGSDVECYFEDGKWHEGLYAEPMAVVSIIGPIAVPNVPVHGRRRASADVPWNRGLGSIVLTETPTNFLNRPNIFFAVEIDCHLYMPTVTNRETVECRNRPLFFFFFEPVSKLENLSYFS